MVARTLSAATIAALRLPTVAEMVTVAARIPQVDQASWSRYNAGPATFLEVGPGVIRIRTTRPGQSDHEKELTWQNRVRAVNAASAELLGIYREPMALLNSSDMDVLAAPDPVKRAVRGRPSNTSRGRIVGWSRKSRNRMQIRLNSLDWTPLFASGNEPAMITLTLPGDWEAVAPTPAAFRAIVQRFRDRYRFAWGAQIQGVWKMEFQRRGAPHLHILMTPPTGIAGGHLKHEFPRWLSLAWAESVGAVGHEREKHEKAGTGIDYVGEGYRDPRRIALYFGKHGMFEKKDYQNEMPRCWRDAIAQGESGAQFWGVWQLEKAVAVLQLDDRAAVSLDASDLTDSSIIGKWVDLEERQLWASDSSVGRAYQRAVDSVGSRSSDAAKVQRHLRKLSKSLAMRGQQLVRNPYGQLVLPRERIRKVDRTMYDYRTGECITRRSYRIGYYHGGGGFLLVHDGRVTGSDIQRILDTRASWTLTA